LEWQLHQNSAQQRADASPGYSVWADFCSALSDFHAFAASDTFAELALMNWLTKRWYLWLALSPHDMYCSHISTKMTPSCAVRLLVELSIMNQHNGNKNSSLGYEMLEALQPGLNFTWALGWQTNIGKNMQLNLTYNGRKSEGANAVHTGNMMVRAYF
jgi:hypothetical protein